MKLNKFGKIAAAGAVAAGAMNGAYAAYDVSAISGSSSDIAAVGLAVFAVVVGIKVIHWVRKAL